MKIVHIPEGTEKITKGMVDKDTDIVIIPNSVKEIENYSLMIENMTPYSYFYQGTKEDWEKVKYGKINNICILNLMPEWIQVGF